MANQKAGAATIPFMSVLTGGIFLAWGLLLPAGASAQRTDAPPPRHHVVNSSDPQSEFSSDPTFKEISWDDVHNVDIAGFSNPPGGWSAAPDGVSQRAVKLDVALKGRNGDFQEKPKEIFLARQAPRAFVTYLKGGDPPVLRVEIIDLAAGKSTGSFDVHGRSNLVDVSPDGKSVLLVGEDKHSRLEIWTLDAAGTTGARTLVCFPFMNDRDHDMDRAMFTDGGHVVAVNTGEKLALFDLAKAAAVWSGKIERGYPPLLSPGGKYLLVRTRDAAYKYREPTLISAETGKPIGMLDPGQVADDPPLSFHSVAAFTPSGKKIAMVDDHNVRVWDLTTGKPSDLFGLPLGRRIWGRPAMAFTNETDAVFGVDGEILVDFARRVPLWQYKPLPESVVKVAADGRCWYTLLDASDKQIYLIGADLPDAKATAAAQKLDPNSLLVLYPGAKVSVKVDVPGPREIQDKIMAELKQKLADLKVEVVDGQDLVVRAFVEEGQPQEAVYVMQGRPVREGHRVHYTVKQSKIVLQREADIFWETYRWDEPSKKIELRPGESIDAAVQRLSRPDYDFFNRAEIPMHIARTHDPLCFGNSTLQPAN